MGRLKIVVDRGECEANAVCAGILPDVFEVDDDDNLQLHEEYPELLPAWHAFQDARAVQRAVDWLVDNELVDEDAAERYLAEHPEEPLP